MAGRGELEPQSEEWGQLVQEQDVQEARGMGLSLGPYVGLIGTRDPGRSVSSWIH